MLLVTPVGLHCIPTKHSANHQDTAAIDAYAVVRSYYAGRGPAYSGPAQVGDAHVARVLAGQRAGRFVQFWATRGAKFPKMWDSLPRTPMNHCAKFDANSFILGREITFISIYI